MREAKAGDIVKWRSATWKIKEIYSQEYWEGHGWRIEFKDTKGGYHHWKQELDGGELLISQ